MTYNPPPAWRSASLIERAEHLYSSFDPTVAMQMCKNEGIHEHDRIIGAELAEQRAERRRTERIIYGAEEYGRKQRGT